MGSNPTLFFYRGELLPKTLVMLCYEGDLSDLNRHGWVCEEKYDGTRVKDVKKNGKVTLINRKGINYTSRLPESVAALKKIEGDFVIDTEAVYINPLGQVEFTPCQRRCSTSDLGQVYWKRLKWPITQMAFDMMELNGEDITHYPYLERKKLLKELLEGSGCLPEIHYAPYTYNLKEAWADVLTRGNEGLILKDPNSAYEYERSYRWLKLKNWKHQTVDVAGYTAGSGARSATFGALVLTKNGKFVGCVGSGFNDWELRQIKGKLDAAPRRIPRSFDIDEPWTAIDIELQVIVKYYKHTENGVMRFPVFEDVAVQ